MYVRGGEPLTADVQSLAAVPLPDSDESQYNDPFAPTTRRNSTQLNSAAATAGDNAVTSLAL